MATKEQTAEKPLLGKYPSALALVSLEFARGEIQNFDDDWLRRMLGSRLEEVILAVKALGDDNYDDKDQIKEILQDILTKSDLFELTSEKLLTAITKIKDARLKLILAALVPQIFELIKLLADTEKDNEAQTKQLVEDFFKSPAFMEVVKGALRLIIKNEQTADRIAGFLEVAIRIAGGL